MVVSSRMTARLVTSSVIIFLAVALNFRIIFDFMKNLILHFPVGLGRTTLLVGILSAAENWEAREAIRESWAQLAVNRSVEIKFLIGDEFCPYPPEDRLTPFGCSLWLINLPSKDVSSSYSTVGDPLNTAFSSISCSLGFTFLVKRRLRVEALGLDRSVFSSSSSSARARVLLVNSKTRRRLLSATFLKEPSSSSGFVWKVTSGLWLEEGFEGELKVSSTEEETEASGLSLSSCSRLLQYLAPIWYFDLLTPTPPYSEFGLEDFTSSLVAMNYSLWDEKSLRDVLSGRAERFSAWRLHQNDIRHRLQVEQDRHGDILLLGGFIDVYDNLSFKMAVFMDWVRTVDSWKYVLKTDDDVFIDLNLVVDRLEQTAGEQFDIWSCIRRGQGINRWGKWRAAGGGWLSDQEVYPAFPSGAGYLLSRGLSHRVASLLRPAVRLGEDLMIGAALHQLSSEEELGIELKEDCCWSCGAESQPCTELCNSPQLSPSLLRSVWASYLSGGRIVPPGALNPTNLTSI